MQLECQNCHQLLNLPDGKLPVGRPFSFNCPYCKVKNTTIIPAEPAPPLESEGDYAAPPQYDGGPPQYDDGPPPAAGPPPEEFPPQVAPADSGSGASSEFNYDDPSLQSLLMGGIDDRPKALVVYDDENIADMLADKLESIGYSPSVAVNLRDAAKQLKFANFTILLVQEDYYGANLHSNHLLKTVQNIDAHNRRNMLVVLISPNMTTLDDLLAFSLSFDAVINTSELGGVDRLLMSIIARANKFYAIYREILAEHGLD
jgi:CheY-like chemotaxis protein